MADYEPVDVDKILANYYGGLTADPIPAMAEEIRYLRERREEHLKLIARLTQETPFPAELEGWTDQRAALIAEVGTLKAEVGEMRRRLETRTHSYQAVMAGTEVTISETYSLPDGQASLLAKVKRFEDALMQIADYQHNPAPTMAELSSYRVGITAGHVRLAKIAQQALGRKVDE
jgi:hypothetical protein